MGIKITSVKESLEDSGLKILVHGQAGSGKTVLSATTGAPTLIVSAESGLLSIRNAPSYIRTTVVKSIEDLEEVYSYLMDEGGLKDFEWVNIDSISEIAEVVLADEKASNKDARAAYGNLQDRMMKILRLFRDMPCNVLMTAKQKRQEDQDTGIVSYVPMLPGSSLTQGIPYLFDEVFALRVEKKQDADGNYYDERVIQTGKDRRYEAKDRSGELDFYEPPSLKKIAEKIRNSIVIDPVIESENNHVDNNDGDDGDEDGYAIADKKLYWVHHESESVGIVNKGERYNAKKMDANFVEFVDKKNYEKFASEYQSSDIGEEAE